MTTVTPDRSRVGVDVAGAVRARKDDRRSKPVRDRIALRTWGTAAYGLALLLLPLYAVRMLRNPRYRAGLRQRLTLYTAVERARFLANGPHVWVHVASMGELQAARPLLGQIKASMPGTKLLVSTFTDTGSRLAGELDEVDAAIYLPLDLYPLCRRALRLARPTLVVVFETELWPNFTRAVTAEGVPLVLVNGRLSDGSFRSYRRLRLAFGPVVRQFSAILAQSDLDRDRFAQVGASPARLTAPGNIKFEAVSPRSDPGLRRHWRDLMNLSDGELLLVAGSTFSGEEAMLVRVVGQLRAGGRPLRLLIAPRHVERVAEIERALRAVGCPTSRRSHGGRFGAGTEVILLDTVGQLRDIYGAADVVFMGKSLGETTGGQNPLEPAAWGLPILSGPRTQNFRDVYSLLRRDDAVIIVNDEAELRSALIAMYDDPGHRTSLGQKARGVLARNQGVLARIMADIAPHLPTVPMSGIQGAAPADANERSMTDVWRTEHNG